MLDPRLEKLSWSCKVNNCVGCKETSSGLQADSCIHTIILKGAVVRGITALMCARENTLNGPRNFAMLDYHTLTHGYISVTQFSATCRNYTNKYVNKQGLSRDMLRLRVRYHHVCFGFQCIKYDQEIGF